MLRYAETNDHRLSVFTAPVLALDDPRYRGIRVPRRFWKVAAWVDSEGDLAAAGFVLDQSTLLELENGILAVAPLGAFRTFQVPISDIGALAGVDFGPLASVDVFGDGAELRRGAMWRELSESADIRLARSGD